LRVTGSAASAAREVSERGSMPASRFAKKALASCAWRDLGGKAREELALPDFGIARLQRVVVVLRSSYASHRFLRR
jgi:hypothetical protein